MAKISRGKSEFLLEFKQISPGLCFFTSNAPKSPFWWLSIISYRSLPHPHPRPRPVKGFLIENEDKSVEQVFIDKKKPVAKKQTAKKSAKKKIAKKKPAKK